MTPRQQRFVEEYLIDLNATQAAIRAGYSAATAEQQGSRLLGNVEVKRAIAQGTAERSERTQLTQDYVIGRLMENVERSMQAVEVLDHEGNPTGEYRYEGNVANGALKLLGQHLGMFVHRTEDVTERLSDEEIERRARAVAEKYKLRLA